MDGNPTSLTSLGKVGGGGYSTGTLDAQRETNRLLTDMNRKLGKRGTGGRSVENPYGKSI